MWNGLWSWRSVCRLEVQERELEREVDVWETAEADGTLAGMLQWQKSQHTRSVSLCESLPVSVSVSGSGLIWLFVSVFDSDSDFSVVKICAAYLGQVQ